MLVLYIVGLVLMVCFGLIVFRGAPYVPTLRSPLDAAMDDLAKIGPGDVVVDLGSGDGVVLAAAARRGARAVGYELNPILAGISWLRLRQFGGFATVRVADIWSLPRLPQGTTLLYVFVVGRDMPKLVKCLDRWTAISGQPLRIVSFGFELPGLQQQREKGAMHLYEWQPPTTDHEALQA